MGLTQQYTISGGQRRTLAEPTTIAAVRGDNGASLYLHFPDFPPGMQWVFPFTYGFCYPLPQAFQDHPVLVTTADTPPGFPASTDTASAYLTTTDEALPYSPGVRLATTILWTPVGSKQLAAGVDSFTTNPVPPTSRTLGLLIPSSGVDGLRVLGTQTNAVSYLPLQGAGALGSSGFLLFPINGLRDSTYVISVTAGQGFLVEAFATDALIPTINQGQQVMKRSQPVVVASDQTLVVQGLPGSLGQKVMASSVSVVTASDQTARPWQAPLKPPISVNATLAAAAASTIVAAVGGQTLNVHDFYVMLDAASATPAGGLALQDSTPTSFAFMSAGVVNPPPYKGSGVPLAVGLGWRILNNSGASVTLRGGGTYSQQV